MCPSGATCLDPRTVVSVSWHYENSTQHVGLVQSGSHHRVIGN